MLLKKDFFTLSTPSGDKLILSNLLVQDDAYRTYLYTTFFEEHMTHASYLLLLQEIMGISLHMYKHIHIDVEGIIIDTTLHFAKDGDKYTVFIYKHKVGKICPMFTSTSILARKYFISLASRLPSLNITEEEILLFRTGTSIENSPALYKVIEGMKL
jgi:hypothetical protein